MLKSIPKIFFIQIPIIMLLLWENYKTPSIQLNLKPNPDPLCVSVDFLVYEKIKVN